MATILNGKEVAANLKERLLADVKHLKERGVQPKLVIVRVGEREDAIAYQRGAAKKCESMGIVIGTEEYPADVCQETLVELMKRLSADDTVHGVLMLRPLPEHINESVVRRNLAPEKDVDGITAVSLAGTYIGAANMGFTPATPEACLEILDYYGIDVTGKDVVVIGMSLVVGKPLSVMLMSRNATVQTCHILSKGVAEKAAKADILVSCAGKAGLVGAKHVKPGQIVIDVGINVGKDGKMCGDVDFAAVEPIAGMITPVPGGVGAVTTSILVKHIVEAAKRLNPEA